ncbi:MAG: class I SAM-dependent methyltransferase [Thermoproteota archaeon]
MKRVAKEWEEAWWKTQINYDRDIYAMISSPDSQEILKILRKYVRKGVSVLEAGCGYGRMCVYFSQYYRASVVGIDIVKEPLKVLNRYLKTSSNLQVFAVAGDVTKLPFREGVFDVITSFGVIEHFRKDSEVIEAIKEASRVLKSGGFLILSVPNFAAAFRNKLVIALSKGRFGMYHKPYTMSALAKIFNMAKGLRVVESGFTPFGFRELILELTKNPSVEKSIYFLYHAIWRMLNSLLKAIGNDYQNPIYIVVKRECSE